MSTVIAKNIQIGTSGTPAQNFTWYQPAAPDGTIRLGVGNTGATTLDAITATSAGNVTISGSVTGGAGSFTTLAASGTVSGTGFSNYLASPPAIGGTVAAAGSFTTLNASTAVRSNTYQDASGGSNAVFSGVASPPNSMGFRNRILNGGMVIDQRNAGASVTQDGTNKFVVDRWLITGDVTSKFTAQRSTVAPAGFSNSVLITSLSAYSVPSGESYQLRQAIEGFNMADFAWGTASAQTVTLSFWVRSSLTGTFGASVRNASANRSYPFSFSINAANTLEYKTVTIPGDTTGTWVTDNGVGLYLTFSMGTGSSLSGPANAWAASNFVQPTGSVSVVGTNGATFYITGVQLEAGTVASPFERRDYQTELIRCKRYTRVFRSSVAFQRFGSGIVAASTVSYAITIPNEGMRAQPSLTATNCFITDASGNYAVSAITNLSGPDSICFDTTHGSGATAGRPAIFGDGGSNNAVFIASAEL